MGLAKAASWFRPRTARATLLGRGRRAGRRYASAICQHEHVGAASGLGQPSTLLHADNPCRCIWSSPDEAALPRVGLALGRVLPDVGLRELPALAHRPSHDRKAS